MKSRLGVPFLALLATTIAVPIGASERLATEDHLNLLKIDVRAAKVEAVTSALELTVGEAERFWPVYREYDAELSKLNTERINLLRDFAINYGKMSDDRAREFSRRSFEFMRRRLDLLEKYTRKIDKAISPAVAARFAEIEHQMLMLVDVQLASELPLMPRDLVASQYGS